MPGILSALLTDKPKVPKYPTVDIEKEQAAAINQDIGSIPGLSDLSSKVNLLTSQQIDAALERALPGYKSLVAKGTANLSSELSGEVPEDVKRQIQRNVAETGVGRGTSGSQFDLADVNRTLGITSLDLSQRALDSASRWIEQARARAPVFDFTSMFISPQQRIALKAQENEMTFQRNWLAAQIKSIPSGAAAVGINMENMLDQIVVSLAGRVGGIGGGGSSGGGSTGSGGYYGTTQGAIGNLRSNYI